MTDDKQLYLTRTLCYFLSLWIEGINWPFPRMLGDIYINPETWGGQKHTFWVSAVSLEDAYPLQDKGPALPPNCRIQTLTL